MTQDEIINELWQKSQDDAEGMRLGYTTQQHYFAALIAAHEREACAKVCDESAPDYEEGKNMAVVCAAAIRARGEK